MGLNGMLFFKETPGFSRDCLSFTNSTKYLKGSGICGSPEVYGKVELDNKEDR